jgi:hypothetical protein
VLEIWPPLIEQLQECRFAHRLAHYAEGDVVDVDTSALMYEQFHYTVWLHGLEHVTRGYGLSAIAKLGAIKTRLLF